MTQRRGWIVATSGDRPIRDIAKDLEAAGFAVARVLEAVGSITGFAAEHVVPGLRAIPGVGHVSPDREVGVGPPPADGTC
jgi:hypothetical protein